MRRKAACRVPGGHDGIDSSLGVQGPCALQRGPGWGSGEQNALGHCITSLDEDEKSRNANVALAAAHARWGCGGTREKSSRSMNPQASAGL